MSDVRVTTSVTDDLLKELVSTEELSTRFNDRGAKLNDADHYRLVVLQMEALAKSVLSARSSGSLLVPKTSGARIHTGSGAQMMKTLDTVVQYLGRDAAALLSNDGPGLSMYKQDNTLCAYSLLRELYSLILGGVQASVKSDLTLVAGQGAKALVSAADAVSAIVTSPRE